MIIACGSNDAVNFTKEHFGESKYFLIYDINEKDYKLLDKVENTSQEEEIHGDPKKAKSIADILNSRKVKAVFAYTLGPNIVRMRKRFVPIISRILNINEALDKLKDHMKEVESELDDEVKSVIFIE